MIRIVGICKQVGAKILSTFSFPIKMFCICLMSYKKRRNLEYKLCTELSSVTKPNANLNKERTAKITLLC